MFFSCFAILIFGSSVSKNSNCCDGFRFGGTITSYATKSTSFIMLSSVFVSFFLLTRPEMKFLEFLYFSEYFVLNTSSFIINSPRIANGCLSCLSLSCCGNFSNGIR